MSVNIIRKVVPESTLEAFLDAQGLSVEMNERSRWLREGGLPRYWCIVPHGETKRMSGDSILSGSAGDGETEADALASLAQEISERILVLDAMGPGRREIRVPRLVAEAAAPERSLW